MPSNALSPHVLIVDDDNIMGELLDALLTLRNYKVTRAQSVEEALDVIHHSSTNLDVVLCDIHMPGLRGGDLAVTLAQERTLGTLAPDTLLLGMSGSAPDAAEARLFDAFLHKPFTVEDLADAIEHARLAITQATTQEEEREQSFSSLERTSSVSSAPPLDDRTFSQLQSQLDEAQLRQLYEMTLADVRMRLERMAASAANGDNAAVRREAHAIKGGCGMVGAAELQDLAAATEGGSALDTSALADFAAACQRLQRMLDERF